MSPVFWTQDGVKSLMWGQEIKNDRDEFLNRVFSNLPDYIEYYANEYEDG